MYSGRQPAFFGPLLLCLIGLVTPQAATTAPLSFVRAIDNPSRSPLGGFGSTLSSNRSGSRIAIAADLDDQAATDAGAVYIYDQNFNLIKKVIHPDGIAKGNLGMSAAWNNSDQLIVGAWTPGIDAPVYVFDAQGELVRRIENPKPTGQGQWGVAVAAIGENFLISSGFEDDMEADAGAVYLYDSQGNQLSRFVSPGQTNGGIFGRSVTVLNEDTFVVGAYGEFHQAADDGQAYVFKTDGTLVGTLVNPNGNFRDFFGIAVANYGGDVIVGEIQDWRTGVDGGEAYLYSQTGELLTTFRNPRPSLADWYGYSATSVGDYAVIGSVFEGHTGNTGGAAYVYDREGNLVQELFDPTPGDQAGLGDVFGQGSTLYVSARYDGGGPNARGPGAVYIYKLNLLPGDVNMDNRVNLDDFISLRKHFGQDVNARADGDLTGDLKVDLADFIQLRANFGKVAPVPEPGGIALTLLAAGGVAWMGVQGRAQKPLKRFCA